MFIGISCVQGHGCANEPTVNLKKRSSFSSLACSGATGHWLEYWWQSLWADQSSTRAKDRSLTWANRNSVPWRRPTKPWRIPTRTSCLDVGQPSNISSHKKNYFWTLSWPQLRATCFVQVEDALGLSAIGNRKIVISSDSENKIQSKICRETIQFSYITQFWSEMTEISGCTTYLVWIPYSVCITTFSMCQRTSRLKANKNCNFQWDANNEKTAANVA